ncbi:2-amino-4-hydroxy-6-hydroxymethyldihydropteridine diphosphokinase [Mycetohabitans endofungorum]|uniref:2-amino-4-hydroxy-6- hydroxymethyldihydropteridine diphosphokinase n=1 Tax=Mycetohabitans endofungorum TaxID=417203 RepID=UPI002B052839|nr:2-amino-4-hydroxy-6-hydroxymethyldihydropteridine diphosphokinase [Mycetohabitans endofungorum]
MTVAYLGLGANLGDARQTLKDAVVCLAQQAPVTVLAKSSLYRTAPVDAGGDDFYNCVVKIDTTLAARQLLALCHGIEHHFGRERPYRNAPRTLDIDILLYGTGQLDEHDLTVPHPRLTERAFALVPLLELDAAIEIPALGRADCYLPDVASQRIEKIAPCQCPFRRVAAAIVGGKSGPRQ